MSDEHHSENDSLELRGVRTHNLKNFDLKIPHGEFVVVTGPSGSGKSSLAFDTIYAEGRRQFLNSLSLKARQALHYLPRPDLDYVNGIQPVICIDQKKGRANKRSTVGTVTEIYDYMRLLMARVGIVICKSCKVKINQSSREEIEAQILGLPERTKVVILAPSQNKTGGFREKLNEIRKAGFVRVRVNAEIADLDSFAALELGDDTQVDAVIDRLIVKDGIDERLAESMQQALKLGEENLSVLTLKADETEWEETSYSTLYKCAKCNAVFDEVETRTFNFNSPFGACSECNGSGIQERFSYDLVFGDPNTAVRDLKVLRVLPKENVRERLIELAPLFALCGFQDSDPMQAVDQETARLFFWGDSEHLGFADVLEKEYVIATNEKIRDALEDFRSSGDCLKCGGSRLCETANSVYLGESSIGQIASKTIDEAKAFFDEIDSSLDSEQVAIATPVVNEINKRLQFLIDVGAGYLTIDRRANTLSGGEYQRVRLATGIGSGLTGACYILDEPSIGLHPVDNACLIQSVSRLQKQGNTIIVVEHDAAIMRVADRLIDMGPSAGRFGGEILANDTPMAVMKNPASVSGAFLSEGNRVRRESKRVLKPETKWIQLTGATLHNLKGDVLKIPVGRFVCITGKSGSGKSSLIHETLVPAIKSRLGNPKETGPFTDLVGIESFERVVEIDQDPIGRSPRSNAATFCGMFDEIRKLFATTKISKQRGYTASRFSFNNKEGACAECGGHGTKKLEMNFMPDLLVTCEACDGRRYNQATLQAHFKEHNIADVLMLSISDALDLFQNVPKIAMQLKAIEQAGLGYLKLGQPATTLSGGEAQRLKIATHLASPGHGKTLYVLDEPTTGLHFVDIQRLFNVLNELVEAGNTVLVIEHNVDMIQGADHVIDMGPDGGEKGGQIIAEGTPEEVALCRNSLTGRYLIAESEMNAGKSR